MVPKPGTNGIRFGPAKPDVVASVSDAHPSPHVSVKHDGHDVILQSQDGEVRWKAEKSEWELSW